MKRLLIPVLVICLLLSGCCFTLPWLDEPVLTPTPIQTDPSVTDTSEPPVEETDPHVNDTEAPQPEEKVTVYLVERTDYFDSGYVQYNYDNNFNILSYDVFSIENEPMFTSIFEEHNISGMPCKLTQFEEHWILSWFEDGKIREAQLEGTFTGYQYEYDFIGNLIQKRSYYEGILEETVCFEYNGDELLRMYCEDMDGNHIYDCRVENGLIIEKAYSQDFGGYSSFYVYDENGNLINETGLYEGESIPVQNHTYKAVEVDASRAQYLMEQQKYLISVH